MLYIATKINTIQGLQNKTYICDRQYQQYTHVKKITEKVEGKWSSVHSYTLHLCIGW